MAKRIATEYVRTNFQLTSSELSNFMCFMEEQQLHLQVLVLENGSQSLVLEDVAGKEVVHMTFELQYDRYVCDCSCRIVRSKLTNAMRKAVSVFRGHAIVNRIYPSYTVVYHYKNGLVQLIVEKTEQSERIIFEKKNTVQKLQRVFDSNMIEHEIRQVHQAIDLQLDLRNHTSDEVQLASIDACLNRLTRRLFELEAN